ncbi:MAG TPA: hypothetical protein VHI52_06005, partial [Verrucomicrobiae bacterium]|nr:hypothetical protein [Verrucomicrobiae bacterium]
RFLLMSSVLGLGITATLALVGVLMPAIRPILLLSVVGVGLIYFACLDWLKLWLFARLDLR